MNFSVYSRDALGVDLLLFDRDDDAGRRERFSRPIRNRSYHYWHVFVPGVQAGQLYGYRVRGPFDPSTGCALMVPKFCSIRMAVRVVVPKIILAKGATTGQYATAMKSVVVDPERFITGKATHRSHPPSRTIIYEMHVRGFTQHPNSGVTRRHEVPFRGLIEKIPYLQDLGITAVEFCRYFSSTLRIVLRGGSITGAMLPSLSSHPTRDTARVGIRWPL